MAFISTIIWLFTIYFSPIVESLSTDDCQRLKCTTYVEKYTCVEINGLGQPFYMAMSKCAAEEFMCLQGAAVKSKFVEVSLCSEKERRANRMLRLELQAMTNSGSIRNFAENPKVHPKCPKSCSSAQVRMVCVRSNNNVYRSFLNQCYARMHRCMYPKEKMELVSRRVCLGLAPYSEIATSLHGPMIEVVSGWTPNEINRWMTLKPTVNVTWPLERTRRHTSTKSHDSDDVKTADETTTMKDIVTVDDETCEGDEDQETTIAIPDKCDKSDRNILANQHYMKVDLAPDDIEDGAPVFTVWNRGSKITSQIRGDVGLMVGCTAYAGVDFSGDVVVNSNRDNDYLGFVFGYQNNKQFYLVTWKSKDSKFWIGKPSIVVGEAGVNIKKVDSITGPSADLRNALYSTQSIKDQVTLLWQDRDRKGWKHRKSYHFRLQHRPQKGLIHFLIETNNSVVVNSEYIYDFTFKGGRVGVYSFSQESIEWTNLQAKCNDTIPEDLENK